MNTRPKAAAVIIAVAFLIALILYPRLPDRMATHWNAAGEADGFSGKGLGIFLMPAVMLVLYGLFLAIPFIDPLRENIEKFRDAYEGFILAFVLFFAYIYLLTLLHNLGHAFNMTAMLVPGFALLFWFMGDMLRTAKRNWFIGIRTPWTLSSDVVWEKTHQLAANLYRGCALIALMGMLLQQFAIILMVGPVILSSLYLVVYSYVEFGKEKKRLGG